jgi:hypothetical protein
LQYHLNGFSYAIHFWSCICNTFAIGNTLLYWYSTPWKSLSTSWASQASCSCRQVPVASVLHLLELSSSHGIIDYFTHVPHLDGDYMVEVQYPTPLLSSQFFSFSQHKNWENYILISLYYKLCNFPKGLTKFTKFQRKLSTSWHDPKIFQFLGNWAYITYSHWMEWQVHKQVFY